MESWEAAAPDAITAIAEAQVIRVRQLLGSMRRRRIRQAALGTSAEFNSKVCFLLMGISLRWLHHGFQVGCEPTPSHFIDVTKVRIRWAGDPSLLAPTKVACGLNFRFPPTLPALPVPMYSGCATIRYLFGGGLAYTPSRPGMTRRVPTCRRLGSTVGLALRSSSRESR